VTIEFIVLQHSYNSDGYTYFVINRSIATSPQFDIPKEEVKAILLFLQSKGKTNNNMLCDM